MSLRERLRDRLHHWADGVGMSGGQGRGASDFTTAPLGVRQMARETRKRNLTSPSRSSSTTNSEPSRRRSERAKAGDSPTAQGHS